MVSLRIRFLVLCFFLGTIVPVIEIYARPSTQSAATLMGVITNAANGNPVVGARIIVNNQVAWSTSGGVYTLTIDPVGTYVINSTKAGFNNYTSLPVVFQTGTTTTVNIALTENSNPPGPATAILDTVPPHVDIHWDIPFGIYELLYDDGIQDDFTLWATAGNMNAVKFTPVGYPASITGGSVNIGQASNYPPGSNPLVPFQIRIYDASGTGGTPGINIGGPFDIIPTALGWVEFTFSSPVTINNGSFYMVMVQGGNAPNAAGLAIDETTLQFRSYARFAGGGGPWFPGSGNFMMRTKVSGSGGPVDYAENALMLQGYQVWRLHQGQEQNPSAWISAGVTSTNSLIDLSWPSLPCSPYRWGVKANYSGNQWSAVTFTNVLGKCWVAPLTVSVTLSCEAAIRTGIRVELKNQVYPDTIYTLLADTSGTCTFPSVWKGTYELKVTKFGYLVSTQQVSIASATTVNVLLLQEKTAPSNLFVDDHSLVATWDVPQFSKSIFSETWTAGSFASNGWTAEGGVNWIISGTQGNPAPSAMFNWSPQALNYSQTLTSREIDGEQAPILKFKYDVSLDNFGTTTINQMAVELWNGQSWLMLKNYSSSGGNIFWTSEEVDISEWSDDLFRIRFRAYGGDTYDLNGWLIDNISVTGKESAQSQSACILGYNFYLENVLSGFTQENKYTIPGSHVAYGNTYNACVLAAYGSGQSDKTCYQFTSHFLWPVRHLQGSAIENVAFLQWEQPRIDTSATLPPGLIGYKIYRNDSLIWLINTPDSLNFYDIGLEPGLYHYTVTAWYDLTPYGFAGDFDESVPAGPVDLLFNYGRPLPFFEGWDEGTFTFNEWRFWPGQGNWEMNMSNGNPAPSAVFNWEPLLNGYNYALESPAIDGSSVHCGRIWLDFNLKLQDQNETGQEIFFVEIWNNNEWHQKAMIANTGSFEWTGYHLDISMVKEKGFRIRFRVKGVNSSDIVNWYVDNIHIYPVCFPALNPTGDIQGFDAHLTWSAPKCSGEGYLLNEGFESELFPPQHWTQSITNTAATWSHTNTTFPIGVHSGNYAATLMWDYNHQDEWLIAENVYVNGNLLFWSYAFQGSTHGDHYYVDISTDQGATWTHLLDMSALPPYSGVNGYNAWMTPYSIDMTQYLGEQVHIAWHAVDGNGQGLWYSWAIDDCSMGGDKIELKTTGGDGGAFNGRSLIGYDIYRRDFAAGDYTKVNLSPVADTTYIDANLTEGQYAYYIMAVFSECVQSTPSDTIVLDVVTNISEKEFYDVVIFPNPAREIIYITSAAEISGITIFNTNGHLHHTPIQYHSEMYSINVASLPPGLYIMHILTTQGSIKRKIVIGK